MQVQDDEVGDGTTSVCVLASELLREAERLVRNQPTINISVLNADSQIAGDGHRVHPQTIVEGFRLASKEALKALEASAVDNRLAHNYVFNHPIFIDPCSGDKDAFRRDLVNIARTTLSSKVLSQDKDYFANLAVDAVLRLQVSFL